MKKTHYKSITMTTGLIALMLCAVLLISLATGLAKANAMYARLIGIILIIACACLSLNVAATILDKPKEAIPSTTRKVIIGIIIATGVVVILWIIVLFVMDPGLILRYTNGKKFRWLGSNKVYETEAEAMTALDAAQKNVNTHLFITKLTICLTIIVAFVNLVFTRRFIFKNRMIPIQVALYIGAFLFYLWLFCFTISAKTVVKPDTSYEPMQYKELFVEPTMHIMNTAPGLTMAFSGLAIYLIATISSAWSIRRFKHEGLYDEKAVVKSDEKVIETPKEETKETNNSDDAKARLEKLKDLHEQGLIDDEDYEKKKKDIIDSL